MERVSEKPNFISIVLEKIPDYALWIVVDIAVLAIFTWILAKRKTYN